MNANAEATEPSPPDPHAALEAAYVTRGSARVAVAEYAGVIARARETVAAAKIEADKFAEEETAWIAQYRKRLSDWVVSGHSGTPPVAVPNERGIIARRSAEVTLQATVQMLADLEAVAANVHRELATAETAVGAAVEALFAAEAAERAAAIAAKLGEIETAGVELRSLLPEVDDLHTPLNRLGRAHAPQINAALELIAALANRRGINTPIAELRGSIPPSLQMARTRIAERRAALIAGEAT